MYPTALEDHLSARLHAGRKLLVPYVTGGLGPDWLRLVEAVVAAGADAVEIGLPFSDPSIDGPTIQEASAKALASGATTVSVLDALSRVQLGVPLVAMTYYNLVFRAGHERFAADLAAAGLSGTIIPDLPPELADDWVARADDAGVANVLLVAPVTSDERIRLIVHQTRGFVYGVSVMGTTGERSSLSNSAAQVARRVKAQTSRPVLIGFGVSSPDHARNIAKDADGVVVASALMRRVLDGLDVDAAAELVVSMRAALDEPGGYDLSQSIVASSPSR
jgi:tryptophan synthase alpha chain